MKHAILAYIPWDLLPAALALGWLPCAELGHHGAHSIACEWRCACGREPVLPGRAG